jgi:hypothetical protein
MLRRPCSNYSASGMDEFQNLIENKRESDGAVDLQSLIIVELATT